MQHEPAVYRLLRSWGGEALYANHEADPQIGPLLREVGTPYIVVAAIPVEDIKTYVPIGERLVNIWCGKHNVRTEQARRTLKDTRARTTAGPNIVRVVEFSHAEFDALSRSPAMAESTDMRPAMDEVMKRHTSPLGLIRYYSTGIRRQRCSQLLRPCRLHIGFNRFHPARQ